MKALLLTAIIFCAALTASGISAADVFITPGQRDAWAALEELRGLGVRVALLGPQRNLSTPAEFRFKRIAAYDFVAALARNNDLKFVWIAKDSSAVLYQGAGIDQVERLLTELVSKDVSIRRGAAWRAGWLNDAGSLPALLVALKDSDAEVARQARVSLRRIGWGAALILASSAFKGVCFEGLSDDLNDADPNVRANSVASLALAPDPYASRVVAQLEKLLDDSSKNVRERAVNGLAHMNGERVQIALEKAFSDLDDDVREETIFALASTDKTRALTLLDEWPTVGHKVLRTRIENFAAKPDLEANAEQLQHQLKSENVLMRSEAVMNLASLGPDKALPHLKLACHDREADVRSSAAVTLGTLSDEDGLSLIEELITDSDEVVRNSAIAALSGYRGEKALDVFAKALKVPDEHERLKILAALRGQGIRALPLLEQHFNSGTAPVRLAAVNALANLPESAAIRLFEEATKDSSSSVRRAAYTAAAQTGGERAMELLTAAIRDPEINARRDAIAALGEIGGDRALQTLGDLWQATMLLHGQAQFRLSAHRAQDIVRKLKRFTNRPPRLCSLKKRSVIPTPRCVAALRLRSDHRGWSARGC